MENLTNFIKNIDFQAIREAYFVDMERLKNFQFSIDNPLFWILIAILLLVLFRFWDFKKAFSFSLIVAVILLALPKLEAYVIERILAPDEMFEPLAVRIPCFLFISFIFIYYAFLKD